MTLKEWEENLQEIFGFGYLLKEKNWRNLDTSKVLKKIRKKSLDTLIEKKIDRLLL
jgi:hypothetical protein